MTKALIMAAILMGAHFIQHIMFMIYKSGKVDLLTLFGMMLLITIPVLVICWTYVSGESCSANSIVIWVKFDSCLMTLNVLYLTVNNKLRNGENENIGHRMIHEEIKKEEVNFQAISKSCELKYLHPFYETVG